MHKLTQFAIENSRFTILWLLAIFVGGIATYQNQPRQEDPQVTLRVGNVVAQFPGLSPERMEQLVTKPIEAAIKQIPEIETIDTVTMTGLTIVSPKIAPNHSELEPIWAELRVKMDDLIRHLPKGVHGPFVNDDFGQVAVSTLALTGDDYTMAELFEIATDLNDGLSSLPLVSKVKLYGIQDERIWVELNPEFLEQVGLSVGDVSTTINAQNMVLPGGTVSADNQRIVIEPSGDFNSLSELENLPLKTPAGGLVYLQDIAVIHRAYVDPPETLAFYNGKPAIVLGVSMTNGSNVVAMGKQLVDELLLIRQRLPVGMDLDVAVFQPDLVETSVNSAFNNLLQTMLVVLMVVLLFLGWRAGLIVGLMVPLTILATLTGMSFTEIELHRVSIAAIIVSLGLLVDNSVVIIEDIRRRLDLGEGPLPAVLQAPKTLALPLLTSSLTTVLAFVPLLLISDAIGEFLRSLGQVVTLALLLSWLISVTVAPALYYWFLTGKAKTTRTPSIAASSISGNDSNYRFYRYCLEFILQHRLAFILALLGALILSLSMFSLVKQRSLGPSERNQFSVYLDLPAGYDITATKGSAETLMHYLLNKSYNPEVTDVVGYVGTGGPRFFLALSPNDPQPNKAFFVVNTQSYQQVDTVMKRAQQYIIEGLPLATGRAELLFLGTAPLGTVEYRISGPEIGTLRQLGQQVSNAFYEIDSIQAVRNDWENPVLKIRVEIDQDRARHSGVTSQVIARTLSGYYDGEAVTVFREREKNIPIIMRAQPNMRDTIDGLRTVEVPSSNGTFIPLMQFADFSGSIEPSKIVRHNQERTLTIAAKHPKLTAVELNALMQEKLTSLALPAGYTIELDGEIKGAEKSRAALFQYAPQALFGVFVLLILQFGSFRRVGIILSAIPLILIGAIWGLLVFEAYFDFTGMLGLFSLAGILINNGIVLIDLIDKKRKDIPDINQAVIAAAIERARPIIMTTLTTIVGLVPLALFGGEFWYGMAIVIMCGLGCGTLLTLGYVPVIYSLLFNKNKRLSAQPQP